MCDFRGILKPAQRHHPPPQKGKNPVSARVGWVQDKRESFVSVRCRAPPGVDGGFAMPKIPRQRSPPGVKKAKNRRKTPASRPHSGVVTDPGPQGYSRSGKALQRPPGGPCAPRAWAVAVPLPPAPGDTPQGGKAPRRPPGGLCAPCGVSRGRPAATRSPRDTPRAGKPHGGPRWPVCAPGVGRGRPAPPGPRGYPQGGKAQRRPPGGRCTPFGVGGCLSPARETGHRKGPGQPFQLPGPFVGSGCYCVSSARSLAASSSSAVVAAGLSVTLWRASRAARFAAVCSSYHAARAERLSSLVALALTWDLSISMYPRMKCGK